MRYKLESSAKEPVDHGGARRGRWSWGRGENRKSNSNANEAGEHLRKAWISAATTVSVNITVTRRRSGVISLTQIGRCRRAQTRGSTSTQSILSLVGAPSLKSSTKCQISFGELRLCHPPMYNHIREDHAPYINLLRVEYSIRLLRMFCTAFNVYVNLTATCRRDWTH